MSEERLLSRNAIKHFILRIDLIKNETLSLAKFTESLSAYFDRTEKRQITNFAITFTKGLSEIVPENKFDYVLSSDSTPLTITVSESANSFWIESSQYKDNSVYKDIVAKINNIFSSQFNGISARRIGLRYINEFKCEKQRHISSILGKRLSSVLKAMITANQSRIIGLEDYNNDGYKLHLQYGIPNKFYPAIISLYDLLLDIDSFLENTVPVDLWDEVIKNLNHSAYDTFISAMNPKYIEELK